MSLEEAIEYFGNLNRVCLALDLRSQNTTKWKKNGYIPYLQQHRLAVITEGELMPDEVDPYLIRHPRSPKNPNKCKTTRKVNNEE